MPCFAEFARVCRPGAIIIYVNSSAGWIANLAKRLVEKHGLFERVTGERVDLGFYVLAQKAGDANNSSIISVKGETKQQRMAGLLRCPLDKSKVVVEQDHLCCEQQHQYPLHDGFPVMLGKSAISTAK